MTQDTLAGEVFDLKPKRGLMTPRAFVAAVLESMQNNGALARAHGVDNWAEGYAEPGYDDPKHGILFGDWNTRETRDKLDWRKVVAVDARPKRFAAIAEYAGYAIEWLDEWTTCDSCMRAIRTSPNSYGWTRAYYEDADYNRTCEACTLQDAEGYLESLEGNTCNAVTLNVDPAAYSYVKVAGDYEKGMHPGQNDDPTVIAKTLRAHGVHRFLFKIDSVGQFDARFSLYVHESETGKVPEHVDSALPYDIATEMSKVLRGEHSDYYTVTTRTVSPEDFIAGKAFDKK
jgi:hypothetical protein